MISTRRSEVLAFFAAFSLAALVGCLDFSGAPCTSSASCPNGQGCVNGTCQPGAAGNTGGGTGTDGGNGTVSECQACAATSDCKAGLECGRRSCDGARACFSSTGTCPSIGGVVCPKVFNFRDCSDDSDCQADAKCLSGRCLQACTHASDCYLPSADLKKSVSASCVSDSSGDARCYPACASRTDAVCGPLDSYCETFSSGSFGYCELGCGGCTTNADCAAGSTCYGRLCDGVGGCYPDDGGSCPFINLTSCPAKNNFDLCTDDSDCGALAKCLAYGTSQDKRCLVSCTTDGGCSEQIVDGVIYASKCVTTAGNGKVCAALCDPAGSIACPTGTTCVGVADTVCR